MRRPLARSHGEDCLKGHPRPARLVKRFLYHLAIFVEEEECQKLVGCLVSMFVAAGVADEDIFAGDSTAAITAAHIAFGL